MKVRACSIHVPTALYDGNNADRGLFREIMNESRLNCSVTMENQLTDEEILARFKGKNRVDIHKKISPVNVPGGGYWLNGVEVDVKQIIDVYRKYVGRETIVVG